MKVTGPTESTGNSNESLDAFLLRLQRERAAKDPKYAARLKISLLEQKHGIRFRSEGNFGDSEHISARDRK